jgi:shikimate kinase
MKADVPGARTDTPAAGTTHAAAGASADRQHGRLRAVIATGGGICDNPSAVEALQSGCTTVYLEDSPEVLYQRIETRGVPAFLDPARPREHFLEIAARRDERYRAFADYTIPVGGRSADEIASTVDKTVR